MDESHHPSVLQMTKAAEWFVLKMRGPELKPHTLVLSGSTGCGKTHIARKINAFSGSYGVDIILKKKIFHWSSCWIDWPRIAEADDEEDFLEMVRRIDESSIVFLDDVGSESDRFKNGVPASRLRRVLVDCKRKWLVMTCNFGMQQMLDRYDARVADRFQAFQWVEAGTVPSYRSKLAQI